MGSIAVDKGLIKLGTQSEFHEQLDPAAIAEHILTTSQDEIAKIIDRMMHPHYPSLWANLPPRVRASVHSRVQARLPRIVHELTKEIGVNIDQLLDVKLMVIGYMEQDPSLANLIFQEMGKRSCG
jgi:hypothetical protein